MTSRQLWAIEYEDLKTIIEIIDKTCETKEDAIKVVKQIKDNLLYTMLEIDKEGK